MSFPDYVTNKNNNTEHYVDTFATYNTGDDATTYAPSKSRSIYSSRNLQRCNLVLRVLTFVCALGAVISTIFAREKDSNGFEMQYTATTAFVFFMIVNAVIAVYAFVSSGIAVFMWLNGSGKSSPGKLMVATLILDTIGVVFLLLAFASAMATEVLSHKGYFVSYSQGSWTDNTTFNTGICVDFGTFCTVFELALGLSGIAIITFLAGTAIDGYYLHLR